MLIDLKYHITTIVAIFLALAVGILVGSSLIGGPSVKRLEEEFSILRAENREQRQANEELSDQIKKHVEFGRASAPLIVYNRLQNRNVAIIQTGDYPEATQRAKSILEEAGAKVISVTTMSNIRAESASPRVVRAVELITGQTDEKEPNMRLLEIIANYIVSGSNPEAMGILEDKGLLARAGEYNRRVLHVVLVGGSRDRRSRAAQQTDLVLIDRLKDAGVLTLVGVEPFDVGTSYVPAYHLKQIPTVDNVDQYIGQVDLVFAMTGETGNFGVKRSADRVAPEYLESGQWRFGNRR